MTNPRTPEYTAEQVAEVVEGLTAIITEPAECWHPTHISRDDIRTVLAEIKRLTLQVESAEADTQRYQYIRPLLAKLACYKGGPSGRLEHTYIRFADVEFKMPGVRDGVLFVDEAIDTARNQEPDDE